MGKQETIPKIKEETCFLYCSEELKVYKLEDNGGDESESNSLLKNLKGLVLYNDMISSVVYEKREYSQLSHIDITFVVLDIKKMDDAEEDVKTSLSRSVLQISGRVMRRIAEQIYKAEIDKVMEVIQNSQREQKMGEIDKFDLLKCIRNSSKIMEKDVDIIIKDERLFCSTQYPCSHIVICGKEEFARNIYKDFSDKGVLYTEGHMSKTDISNFLISDYLICISEKYLDEYIYFATNQHNGLKKQALIRILEFLGENLIKEDMTMKVFWDKIKDI